VETVNSLRTSLPVVLAASGMVLMFLGLASIPALELSFSNQAAALVILGGVVLIISFLVHSEVSRESLIEEKAYVFLMCAAIMLVAIAIVTFMVVHVDYELYRVTIPEGGPYASGGWGVITVVNHIYWGYAAVLILTAIGLALNALYIRSRMP
jgi:hypothetical protein